MATFVMGDLHGNWRALCECLKMCGFDYHNDILIQLGDVVDGGNNVYECVEELLKIKQLLPIRGNHDAWLNEFIKTGYHPANWLYGGISTVKSYSLHANKKPKIISTGSGFKVSMTQNDIPIQHQHFFDRQLPYYIDDDDNCFVHAGFNRFQAFEIQNESAYYWDRTLWQDALDWQIKQRYTGCNEAFDVKTHFKCIFLGHTSTLNWGLNIPLKAAHVYNLDTGSGKNGRLTIMNVATKQYWQSSMF